MMKSSIAERLGVGTEPIELKFGKSFTNGSSAFHTIRYDFKPASVDPTKVAHVEIGSKQAVTVTVPHVEGSNSTVYKGSVRPYTRECVLIIDRATNTITLERLQSNLQLKKTRAEGSSRINAGSRPITPIEKQSQQRPSPQKHLPSSSHHGTSLPLTLNSNASSSRISPPSSKTARGGLGGSGRPGQSRLSPTMMAAAKSRVAQHHSAAAANSMPLLAESKKLDALLSDDEMEEVKPAPVPHAPEVARMSSSSSDSSSSSEWSDDEEPAPKQPPNNISHPHQQQQQQQQQQSRAQQQSMPRFSSLTEDLRLSESGSDSD